MTDSKPALDDHHNHVENTRYTLYVKYMVCLRDKLYVKSVLDKLGLPYKMSIHGALEFSEQVSQTSHQALKSELARFGMILLGEKESGMINRIIHTIIEVIHYTDSLPKLSFSDLVDEYAETGGESLLKIFSDVKGMSVVQFIVIQKIERAKELLLYEELSLSEIATKLNYRNQEYLSAQFKKVTGLPPSYFRLLKQERMELLS